MLESRFNVNMFFEEAAFVGIIGALTGLAAVLVGKVMRQKRMQKGCRRDASR
jgi:hypothetical protein